MTNFEENSVSRFQFLFQFLILLANAILTKMNNTSKSFNEKFDKLRQISSKQTVAIDQLKAENELLKLKESKMKLAIENLLARTEMELNQIADLKQEVDQMKAIENDGEIEIENLEKTIARKDREFFKTQLKIDFIKLQLQ